MMGEKFSFYFFVKTCSKTFKFTINVRKFDRIDECWFEQGELFAWELTRTLLNCYEILVYTGNVVIHLNFCSTGVEHSKMLGDEMGTEIRTFCKLLGFNCVLSMILIATYTQK